MIEMYVCIYNFYKLLATTAKLNRMYYMKKRKDYSSCEKGKCSDCMKRTMGNTPLL